MNCPSCGTPLKQAQQTKGWFTVWCGHGPCKSIAANDGADGATLDEAFTRLKAKIEEELQED